MRREMAFVLMALAMTLPVAAQAPRQAQPVGLVLGAGGTLVRGKAPAAPLKAGEVLFAGDVLRAGSGGVTFLFCPDKFSATLPAQAEATLGAAGVQVKPGELSSKKPVAACYLPQVQQLSVASQQHFGVMLARAGSTPPPKTSLSERVAALPAEKRAELESALANLSGQAPEVQVQRAAALERAGLLYDAGEAYRAAASAWPETAWLKLKVNSIENQLLKQQQAQ